MILLALMFLHVNVALQNAQPSQRLSWKSAEFMDTEALRRVSTNPAERKQLTQRIWDLRKGDRKTSQSEKLAALLLSGASSGRRREAALGRRKASDLEGCHDSTYFSRTVADYFPNLQSLPSSSSTQPTPGPRHSSAQVRKNLRR